MEKLKMLKRVKRIFIKKLLYNKKKDRNKIFFFMIIYFYLRFFCKKFSKFIVHSVSLHF